MSENDYRIQHQAPSEKTGAPLSDLTGNGVYPDDIYDERTQIKYYGTGEAEADRESLDVINRVRGNPDAMVTVYRALPLDADELNRGDWITLSPTYAKGHLTSVLHDAGHVVSFLVRAGDLYTNGDSLNEFGWAPEGVGLTKPDEQSPDMDI